MLTDSQIKQDTVAVPREVVDDAIKHLRGVVALYDGIPTWQNHVAAAVDTIRALEAVRE